MLQERLASNERELGAQSPGASACGRPLRARRRGSEVPGLSLCLSYSMLLTKAVAS